MTREIMYGVFTYEKRTLLGFQYFIAEGSQISDVWKVFEIDEFIDQEGGFNTAEDLVKRVIYLTKRLEKKGKTLAKECLIVPLFDKEKLKNLAVDAELINRDTYSKIRGELRFRTNGALS